MPSVDASPQTVNNCPAMPVTETDVGIRAWTNDLPGFTGIIKQRWAGQRGLCAAMGYAC